MYELNNSTQFDNTTDKTLDNHDFQCNGSWPSTRAQLFAYLFIMVSSLTGNVLIVAIFFRDKTLKTTVNYFIVNMCVSDLIFPIFFLPTRITLNEHKASLHVVGLSPALLCKVIWISFGVSTLVSWLSMTMLAADRFRAIIYPMKPALFSKKKCQITIAVIWMFSIAILVYYTTDVLRVNTSKGSCNDFKWNSTSLSFLWIFLVLVCLSVAVVTLFYSRVAIFLHRQKNSLHLASEVVKKRAKRNRKIIAMLMIIVILFYVAWTPYCFTMFLIFVFHVFLPCFYVWFTSFFLIMMYPVINPIVYFVFNEKYRQGLKQILCCLWLCMKGTASNGRQENQVQTVGQVNQAVDNVELYKQNK